MRVYNPAKLQRIAYAKGMTPKKLAKAGDLASSKAYNLLSGKWVVFSAEDVEKVCKALGVTWEEISDAPEDATSLERITQIQTLVRQKLAIHVEIMSKIDSFIASINPASSPEHIEHQAQRALQEIKKVVDTERPS